MSSQVSTLRSPEMGNVLSQRLWNWKDVALMSITSLLGVIVGAIALYYVTMPANAGTASGLTAAYMLSLAAVQAVVMLASVWGLGLLRRKASWACKSAFCGDAPLSGSCSFGGARPPKIRPRGRWPGALDYG